MNVRTVRISASPVFVQRAACVALTMFTAAVVSLGYRTRALYSPYHV